MPPFIVEPSSKISPNENKDNKRDIANSEEKKLEVEESVIE